jgi:hypothetical protein
MSQATGAKIAPASKKSEQIARVEPTFEEIRQRAYEIYLSRGDEPGDDVQDWLQAELELRSKQS